MKSLWPFVAGFILILSIIVMLGIIYFFGSIVGEVLERLVLAIPGFLYRIPSYIGNLFYWLIQVVWNAVLNPLHTICLLLGILLVVTFFRGISGGFDSESEFFRGSKVGSAQDIFPELNKLDEPLGRRFRGSTTSDFDSTFDSPKLPLWNRLCLAIKNLVTRTSDGDDPL